MKWLALTVFAASLAATSVAQIPANRAPDAPALAEGTWLNVPDGKPIKLAERRGKVTMVAFWTFACSNCVANFEPYRRLLAKHRPQGVELISIHTPEIQIERDVEQVKKEVAKRKIDYPVLIDNEFLNWKRWQNNVWPTLYLIDADGRIRFQWVGELNWKGAGGEQRVSRVLDLLVAESKRSR